jgi:hypothetical protein
MPIDWLIYAGAYYCDGSETESDRNIMFRSSFIGYFLLGFYIVTTGNMFFMFDYDTKEKEHQSTRTNQIASCFDALSITYWQMCIVS